MNIEETQEQKQQNQETTEAQPVKPPDAEKTRKALAGDKDIELPNEEPGKSGQEPSGEKPQEPVKQEEPKKEEPVKEESKKEEPVKEEEPKRQEEPKQQEDSKYTPNPIWNRVKKEMEEQLGEGAFKMPEGLTAENEDEVLLNFLQGHLEPGLGEIPQEAKEIIELSKKGLYEPQKYFQTKATQVDYAKLPDDELLFQSYKHSDGKSDNNPDGLTDQDIKEHIEGLNKVEKRERAQAIRAKIGQAEEQREQQREQATEKLKQERIQSSIKSTQEKVQKVVNQHQDTHDYFGIEFTSDEKKQFDKDFTEMSKIDPETGMNKIGQIISDDNALYKLMALYWKGENLKGYIHKVKEDLKQSIEEKIDPTLEEEKGTTKIAKPVDRSKLV